MEALQVTSRLVTDTHATQPNQPHTHPHGGGGVGGGAGGYMVTTIKHLEAVGRVKARWAPARLYFLLLPQFACGGLGTRRLLPGRTSANRARYPSMTAKSIESRWRTSCPRSWNHGEVTYYHTGGQALLGMRRWSRAAQRSSKSPSRPCSSMRIYHRWRGIRGESLARHCGSSLGG